MKSERTQEQTAMDNVRFLVAKYIPDLQRFEPRNVGVIACAPDGIAARFAGESPQKPGEIDGRRIPDFIQSQSTYRQWVRHWRTRIEKAARNGADQGQSIDFLQTLIASSKGNYVIVDGGLGLDPVPAAELPRFVDHLFRMLVSDTEETTSEEDDMPTLAARCKRLFHQIPLPAGVRLLTGEPVPCQVGETERDFRFDYVLKNGVIQGTYDRFELPKWKKVSRTNELWKRIDAAAFKFDKVIEQGIAERDHTAALIYAGEDDYSHPDIRRAIDMLDSVTHVVNVADMPKATNELRGLVPTGH